MSKGIRTLTLLAGAVAFSPRSFGQDTLPGGLPIFRSDTQLVLTGFHVVAAKRNVTGLTASDFQLWVDGRPHAITTFEQGGSVNTPVEIVLVFDSSGSVHGAGLLDERLFRDNLLAGLPEVTVSVYAFGGPPVTSLVRASSPTSDPLVLRRAFQSVVKKLPGEAAFDLHKPGKDSLIYESIVETLRDCARYPRPVTRLMLVVSDGLPGGELNPAQAASAALQMGIPIYPLLVGHQARITQFNMRMSDPLRPGETPEDGAARARYAQTVFDREEAQATLFTALGEATGGRSFDPPELKPSAARDIIGFLAGEVRTQYIIGFSPESGSKRSPHKIEIRLLGGRPGAKIAGGSRIAVY
jgi:VWFA-related protein